MFDPAKVERTMAIVFEVAPWYVFRRKTEDFHNIVDSHESGYDGTVAGTRKEKVVVVTRKVILTFSVGDIHIMKKSLERQYEIEGRAVHYFDRCL